ncbi:MAG: DNA repair protein RecO [Pseudomonadota bacterium]
MSAGSRVGFLSAFVLHRRPYRESSLLLDLFSREAGRIGAVARGARRSRRARAGQLQPFVPLKIRLAGRGELKTVSTVESDGPLLLPLGGQPALAAMYLNELLLRLTGREDPIPELFDGYAQTLAELRDEKLAPALRRFELMLLDALGYGMELQHEAETGKPVQPEQHYHYVVESGPTRAAAPEAVAEVSGRTLLALAAGDAVTGQQAREARRLMSQVLRFYLGDRPLRTRELYRQIGGTRP